jgi:hypothetical protein
MLVACVTTLGTAHGAWNSISNLESANVGPLGSQEVWTTVDSERAEYSVAVDPDNPGNKTILAVGDSDPDTEATQARAYLGLGASTIPVGSTGTVFFRMRAGDGADFVFGASDSATPVTFSDFEGYMVMAGNQFRVRNAGANDVVGSYMGDEWYNVWLVLDNNANQSSLYVSQGTDPAGLLGSGAFRTGNGDPSGDLVSLNLIMGRPHTANSATGYLDDVFVDNSGSNLSLPATLIPEPSTGLLAFGGLLVTKRRRRQSR